METFKLSRITREHILQAMQEIDQSQPILRTSTVYDVVYRGKRYPPRELIRWAYQAATGAVAERAAAGSAGINAYLEKLGFAVVHKRPLFNSPPADEEELTELAAPAEMAVALSHPAAGITAAAEAAPVYHSAKIPPYSLATAVAELFLEENQIKDILAAWRRKKNIILQGPPGTGKSFLAKRLAFLAQESEDPTRVELVQFHAGYAYDDFIQGYRPDADGKFKLTNGVFYNFCRRAMQDLNHSYFFVIEEINRGNVGSIFGELLFLLEADKRGPAFATTLTYGEPTADRFYVPENIYLIGTMNTADRALTLLDYALRRRFAFFQTTPQLGPKLRQFLTTREVEPATINRITQKMTKLNAVIAADAALGPGFQIGHAYFSQPPAGAGTEWFNAIVDNELTPLLEEYWFDNPAQAKAQLKQLQAD